MAVALRMTMDSRVTWTLAWVLALLLPQQVASVTSVSLFLFLFYFFLALRIEPGPIKSSALSNYFCLILRQTHSCVPPSLCLLTSQSITFLL